MMKNLLWMISLSVLHVDTLPQYEDVRYGKD